MSGIHDPAISGLEGFPIVLRRILPVKFSGCRIVGARIIGLCIPNLQSGLTKIAWVAAKLFLETDREM